MRKETVTKGGKEFGDYLIGKTIGQGTFGKVKSAIHKPTGQTVAIKILEKSKITEVADVERVSREIHILKLIRHPNIVQLYEIIQTPKQLFLVMQFMEKGELFDHIVANKRLNEVEAARMFYELISGIEYIHKIGVVHRDLKPQNILLDSKKSIRVVDFGLSNTYKKGEQLKTPCGSPCYAAPEMIKGEKYDGLRVDIWSCGVILFAMVCGYLPFEDPDTNALYKKILSGSYTFHKSVSQQAKDLINHILNNNQNERFTIDQIRGHPWLNRPNLTENNPGIVIGFNKIPIDPEVLASMKQLNIDPDHVSKCLQANRHNSVTTSYYLSLKKYINEGGHVLQSSKQIDRTMIEPRRKNTTNILIDNFFTKSTETEGIKRKSREKSRERIESRRSRQKIDKENKCVNLPSSVVTSIHNESKRGRITTLKPKINDSLNYGRIAVNRSMEKQPIKRENLIENRISRKYKEKFNQSLVSKSKDKCTQRSRVNSSVNGIKKDLHPIILEEPSKNHRTRKNLKCQTSKLIETTNRLKPRKL